MLYILLIPFILQAILMLIDEAFFHLRRGLPRWERIGHPIDTLSFIVCLLVTQFFPCTTATLLWYIVLALASCLLITKDEFVHKHHCPVGEQWIHSVLFVNHPFMLTALALIWYATTTLHTPPKLLLAVAQHKPTTIIFLKGQTIFALVFMGYQIIFWNILWKMKKNK
ncbi:MAG: hypothetical protein FJZ57_04340 [Chlamydiae bacterium]|nr:hypothetical protein [Chlamydiota bacterium]